MRHQVGCAEGNRRAENIESAKGVPEHNRRKANDYETESHAGNRSALQRREGAHFHYCALLCGVFALCGRNQMDGRWHGYFQGRYVSESHRETCVCIYLRRDGRRVFWNAWWERNDVDYLRDNRVYCLRCFRVGLFHNCVGYTEPARKATFNRIPPVTNGVPVISTARSCDETRREAECRIQGIVA